MCYSFFNGKEISMEMKDILKVIGGVGAIVIVVEAISWIITCGVIKLVTVCFGWTFKWSIATGIWLVMELARTVFKSNTTVKK